MEQIKVITHSAHLGASSSSDALDLIVRALSLKHAKEGEWADKYGTEYEDDTILIRPDYMDAECDCGRSAEYEKAGIECKRTCYWRAAHRASDKARKPHRKRIDALLRQRDKFPPFDKRAEPIQAKINAESDKERRAQDAVLKALCKKYCIPWNKGWGCLAHCSCGAEEANKKWWAEHPHAERCPVVLPNFWHKPTGFKLEWYKYIGRDMEINMEPPIAELLKLVSEEDVEVVIKKGEEAHKSFAEMFEHINRELATEHD